MNYPIKGVPKEHQLKALTEAGLKEGHAFWMDPGAGKTFTTIAEASLLFEQGKVDGMLVVAPNGPHEQWIDEQWPLWADVPWQGTHNKAGKKKVDAFFTGDPLKRRIGVAAINYDALRTVGGKAFLDRFYAKYKKVYLVVDESQKVKNPKAQRTEAVLELAGKSAYRRVLSGTPILKGLEDLFTQYETVKHGITGPFTRWTAYRNFYCKTAPIPGARSAFARRIVGYQNEDLLMARTKAYATRITSDEFMKGETPDFIPVSCPMEVDQRVAYITMAEMLLADIDGGRITAQNALVQMGKLMQIASGFLFTEDEDGDRGVQWLGDNKIEATLTLLESLDEPVIIWAPLRPLQSRMLQELEKIGYPVTMYTERADVELWKQRGGAIIGNQGSGLGVGQNLQHAAANIYMAQSFSSEARWQSIKRTDRIGQTRQVRIWDLLAPGTVDHKAVRANNDKEDISRRNIDGLKELLL